jgi:hypothetical protein
MVAFFFANVRYPVACREKIQFMQTPTDKLKHIGQSVPFELSA